MSISYRALPRAMYNHLLDEGILFSVDWPASVLQDFYVLDYLSLCEQAVFDARRRKRPPRRPTSRDLAARWPTMKRTAAQGWLRTNIADIERLAAQLKIELPPARAVACRETVKRRERADARRDRAQEAEQEASAAPAAERRPVATPSPASRHPIAGQTPTEEGAESQNSRPIAGQSPPRRRPVATPSPAGASVAIPDPRSSIPDRIDPPNPRCAGEPGPAPTDGVVGPDAHPELTRAALGWLVEEVVARTGDLAFLVEDPAPLLREELGAGVARHRQAEEPRVVAFRHRARALGVLPGVRALRRPELVAALRAAADAAERTPLDVLFPGLLQPDKTAALEVVRRWAVRQAEVVLDEATDGGRQGASHALGIVAQRLPQALPEVDRVVGADGIDLTPAELRDVVDQVARWLREVDPLEVFPVQLEEPLPDALTEPRAPPLEALDGEGRRRGGPLPLVHVHEGGTAEAAEVPTEHDGRAAWRA